MSCISEPDTRGWLDRVEFERLLVHEGVERFLDEERTARFIARDLPEVQRLRSFHLGISGVHKDLWAHTLKVVRAMPPELELRWAALLHDIGKVPTRKINETGKVTFWRHEKVGAELTRDIGRRLNWSQRKITHIAFIVEHHGRFNAYETSWTDRAIRRLIRDAGPYLSDLLTFSSGDLTTENNRKKRKARREEISLRERINLLSRAEPKLPRGLGEYVIQAFAMQRGPDVRAALDWLREEIRCDRVPSTLEPQEYIEVLARKKDCWQIPS